jgi:DNA-binding MarR family transcriptional regulator
MELIADTTRKVMMLPIENVNLNKRYYKAISVQYAKLVRNILIAFGAPVGRKTSQRLCVPPWIKNDSFEIKASFIQALFDDEATISVRSRQIVLGMWKRVDIIDNLTNFFSEIKSILNEFGINGITITDGYEYVSKDRVITKEKRLRICGIVNFEKFKEKIGFVSSRKNKLLNELIQSIQASLIKKYSSKIKIIELLKTKGQLNTSELAKEIGKTRRITGDNLRDLENLGKVSRIRSQNKTKPDIWFLSGQYNSITEKFFCKPVVNQNNCCEEGYQCPHHRHYRTEADRVQSGNHHSCRKGYGTDCYEKYGKVFYSLESVLASDLGHAD